MKNEVSINQDPDGMVVSVVVNGVTFKPEIQEKVTEKPKQREPRPLDLWLHCGTHARIKTKANWLDCYGEEIPGVGFPEHFEFLFNILEIIAEAKKVESRDAERFMSMCREWGNRYVTLARTNYNGEQGINILIARPGVKEFGISLSKSDAFRFFAQGLALCREEKSPE